MTPAEAVSPKTAPRAVGASTPCDARQPPRRTDPKEFRVNRSTRTTISLLVTTAASIAAVLVTPLAAQADSAVPAGYEYQRSVQFPGANGGSAPDTLTDTINTAADVALGAAATCVPTSTSSTIHQPTASAYTGVFDSVYLWSGLVEASITGCKNNKVTTKGQYHDQALNGGSPPVDGEIRTGTGTGKAEVVVDLVQRYDNVEMASGLYYHALTVTTTNSQTDGKTTTSWCTTKTWVYLPLPTGPDYFGQTDQQKVAC